MTDKVRRLLELKDSIKAFFEVTGIGETGWDAAFRAVRRNDDLADSFVTDLRKLVMYIESEFQGESPMAMPPLGSLHDEPTMSLGGRGGTPLSPEIMAALRQLPPTNASDDDRTTAFVPRDPEPQRRPSAGPGATRPAGPPTARPSAASPAPSPARPPSPPPGAPRVAAVSPSPPPKVAAASPSPSTRPLPTGRTAPLPASAPARPATPSASPRPAAPSSPARPTAGAAPVARPSAPGAPAERPPSLSSSRPVAPSAAPSRPAPAPAPAPAARPSSSPPPGRAPAPSAARPVEGRAPAGTAAKRRFGPADDFEPRTNVSRPPAFEDEDGPTGRVGAPPTDAPGKRKR